MRVLQPESEPADAGVEAIVSAEIDAARALLADIDERRGNRLQRSESLMYCSDVGA